MAANGQVIENPASGERIVIRETAADTEGRLLSFELFLAPGGRVPNGHAHPEQEETFTVISGRMRFRRGFRVILAGPRQRVVMSRGVYHSFANPGDHPAHVLVEVRPALRMAQVLEMAAELGQGVSPGRVSLGRMLRLALFLREFRREIGLPLVPPWLVTAITAPLVLVTMAVDRAQRFRSLPASP
ncbi:MAG: cupin domain-containing protein [Candidatus Dormiibacterota bacterium]